MDMFIRKDPWSKKRKVTTVGWLTFGVAAAFLVILGLFLWSLYKRLSLERVQSSPPTAIAITSTPSPTPTTWVMEPVQSSPPTATAITSTPSPTPTIWVMELVKEEGYPWLVCPEPPTPPFPRPKYPWPVWKVKDSVTGREKYDIPDEVKAWLVHDLWETARYFSTHLTRDYETLLKFFTKEQADELYERDTLKPGELHYVYKPVEAQPSPIQGLVITSCSEDGKMCIVVQHLGKRKMRAFDPKTGQPAPYAPGGEYMEVPAGIVVWEMRYDETAGRWKVAKMPFIPGKEG